MGMYTTVILDMNLSEDTPDNVIKILKQLIYGVDNPYNYIYGHLRNPLRNDNYFIRPVTSLQDHDCFGGYTLRVFNTFKNYDNEIEKFLEWIKPYLKNWESNKKLYAIVYYEEAVEPTFYYLGSY